MSVHVFGIRHHGPGSARSLVTALDRLEPDAVLVEGPVEAEGMLGWVAEAGLRPPVALLVYRPEEPRQGVFYPFAEFSPEWNALRWAARRGAAARFIDLPKANWMALAPEVSDELDAAEEAGDPFAALAALAGEADGERWWDRVVESSGEADVFPAIHEAVGAMREGGGSGGSQLERLREAAMRQQVRQAVKEGFARVAVVCGAWHAPALMVPATVKEDAALLKGLAKVKVETTWVPWTHGRLQRASGYGAGVESPGWYAHVWGTPEETGARWLARVARLLREQDLDASAAQVVEAVRLAEALAGMRGRRRPGLAELNEAVEAVLLFGNARPMGLIASRLIVGEALGEVPPGAMAVPVQRDLEALQKRLRLKREVGGRDLELDLRKEGDRERSRLLHRLGVLGIGWGTAVEARGKLGTFHEHWQVAWKPEFEVDVIAAARWGNTVEQAAEACARERAMRAGSLGDLTELLEPVLSAGLSGAAMAVVERVRVMAAVAPDIGELLDVVTPLARVARYGDVRETDPEMVRAALAELFARACVGLPGACGSLNEEAARAMANRVGQVNLAIGALDAERFGGPWREALRKTAELPGGAGLMGGRCWRLLFEAGSASGEELAMRASQALSPGVAPAEGAAWMEGLLEQAGSLLLANRALWEVVDGFVGAMTEAAFVETLPLLRRTFAGYSGAERMQLGERARGGGSGGGVMARSVRIDAARAAKVLPLLGRILDVEAGGDGRE